MALVCQSALGPTLAIFPYLKTSRAVRIRGIELRPISDLTGLPAESQHHLQVLSSMFFLRDNFRLTDMTYAHLAPAPDQNEFSSFWYWLAEAQALVTYMYCCPQGSRRELLFRPEHCTLYLLNPSHVPGVVLTTDRCVEVGESSDHRTTSQDAQAEGYVGRVDLTSPFWVATGGRIYPPLPWLPLNPAQDVSSDLASFLSIRENWPFSNLIARYGSKRDVEERVFTALQWYNRGNCLGIGEDVALVDLAIAFESLFGLEQGEGLTSRFKETVLALLGPVPRLDSCLEQFYTARSKIVHRGSWPHLTFYPAEMDRALRILKGKETGTPHHPLTTYARVVFRLCLTAILSGAKMAEDAKLSALLVSNQERTDQICAVLSKSQATPQERILSVMAIVRELEANDIWPQSDVKTEAVVGTGRLLVKTLIDADPRLPEGLMNHMELILSQDSRASLDIMQPLFVDLVIHIGRTLERGLVPTNDATYDMLLVVRMFADYASRVLMAARMFGGQGY